MYDTTIAVIGGSTQTKQVYRDPAMTKTVIEVAGRSTGTVTFTAKGPHAKDADPYMPITDGTLDLATEKQLSVNGAVGYITIDDTGNTGDFEVFVTQLPG